MFPIQSVYRFAVATLLATATGLAHAAASAPAATTQAPGNVTTTSATLNGTVAPNEAKTTVAFDFGATTAYGSNPAASPSSIGRTAGATAVSATVSGLTCGSAYHYRVRASNRKGSTSGNDQVLNTAACTPPPTPVAPTANTAAASSITATGATLNGAATAGSATATLSFEYGTTTTYGSSTAAVPASLAATGSSAMSAVLSSLACATTYHFRARAVSSVGTAVGANQTFATAACAPTPIAPTATTSAATAIGANGATLNGAATAGSASATLSFEYGTTTAYGSSTAAVPASVAANGNSAMSAVLSSLACATTYHFRARAASSVGTAVGANQTFATTACTPPPPTACSSTTVHCVSAVAGPNQEYATIQAAVNVAVAGDTVLVFDGNYVGFVVSRSGTASAPITVKANGTAAVVDRPSSAGEGIRVTNSSHVVIEGFTVTGITGFGLAARGATPTSPMRGLVFRNNTVRNCGADELYANIYASQVADSLIEGNVASGSPGHGLYLANAGSDNTIVRGNHFHNNAVNGIHLNGDASVGGDGLHTGIVLEENILNNNGANGADLDGVQSSTFRNNLIYANGRHGIRAFAIDGSAGPRNLVIANNTVLVSGSNTCVKLTEDLGGHTIFNNILVNTGSGGTIIVGHSTVASDLNTFVNPGFSVNGGSSMLSLAQWRAQGDDASSQTSTQDALFVSAAAFDYRLRAGSPAIDRGAAAFNGKSAPAEDIAGVARLLGAGYDQGAFESF